MLVGFEADAGLVLVVAGRGIDQRTRPYVLPQRLERLLDLGVIDVVAQAHIAMHVYLKRRGLLTHGLARKNNGHLKTSPSRQG